MKQILHSQQTVSLQEEMQQKIDIAELFATVCKFFFTEERHAQVGIERQFEFTGSL